MPSQLAVRFLLFCSQILLQLVVVRLFVNAFSANQKDCQVNELFIECGTCEGSCREPIIANCRKECKPPRCECRAKLGYVRAHDGACVPISECATYKGIHLAKDNKMPSLIGDSTKESMHNEMRNDGKEIALPPSIRPPAANGHHSPSKHQTLHDKLIQVGPSPPVVFRPSAKSHPIGKSRMNLFADLANANFETVDAEGDNGAADATTVSAKHQTIVHSVQQPSQSLDSLLHQSPANGRSIRTSQGDKDKQKQKGLITSLDVEKTNENVKMAKCGERRCSTTTRAIDETSPSKQQLSSDKQLKNKNNSLLFAFMNHPPSAAHHQQHQKQDKVVHFESVEETAENDGTLQPTKHFAAREERQIMPLAPNLRIYRQRRRVLLRKRRQ